MNMVGALLETSRLPRPRARDTIPGVSGERVTDGELLVRIARGDPDAFSELYERYARSVYGLALRRLRDRDRAEEAVQETFAAVWRSARSYRLERGAGGAWLFAVARNAIVDRFREHDDASASEASELASNERPPDEAAEAGWLAWRVHRALGQLPQAEREVLELAYWGDMSQSEVAAFLNIPLGTVKTRTRSGLGRLSRLLDEEDLE